jgi:hypothetical protein
MNFISGHSIRSLEQGNRVGRMTSGSETVYGRCLRATLVFLICAMLGASAFGQSPTASIIGTVLDPQGLPVEGAKVTLTNQGTTYSYTTTTSSTGGYQFLRIDSAVYSVTVTTDSFRIAVVQNIKLDAATDYSVPPIKLEVGPTKETITVEAGEEVVNTTDTEVSSTVEKKQIDDLPVLNRNPLGLLELEPGVNQNNGLSTTIGGQRDTYSNVTLDGINIQDNFIRQGVLDYTPNLPFNSQAQEFTLINQNAGVEYAGGASQVAIVTPRGTNQYHGEGFYYYRTNAWAANDWFNDASGVPLGKLIQNQGGGNFGGPIIKDKLFIYGYYELLRAKQNQANETTVLSPAILAALASPTPTLPFTYTSFDGNGNATGTHTVDLLTVQNTNPNRGMGGSLSPATTFPLDPTMLALIEKIPASKTNNTRVGDGVNLLGYQFNQRANATQDNYGFRADYNLNTHNTITGTWAWNRQVVDRPGSGYDSSYDVIPIVTNNYSVKFLSVAWRWSPSGTITNEARFGFNLQPAYFYSTQQFGDYLLSGLPFTNVTPDFLPQGRDTHTWTGLDNASFTKGNHTIKFGGQIYRTTIHSITRFGDIPTFNLGFSNQNPEGFSTSDFPAASGSSIGNTDFNNAESILASAAGILTSVSQTFNATSQTSGFQISPLLRNYRQNQYAVYAGDSWRISPRLTLNYGLRWEYYGPVDEKNGLGVLPVIPPGTTPAVALLGNATEDFAGGNSSRGFYNGYWKSFAPNIGIAWDPFGNGKTAVRAGFSINYVNDEFFTAVADAVGNNTGLSTTPTNSQLSGPTVSNPMGAQTVQPPLFQIPITFAQNALNAFNSTQYIGNLAGYGIDPNIKPPQIQQWNLSIQRDIGWNTSLQVSYVGNHGVGLFRAIDANQLNFNATAVCNPAFGVQCPTDTFFQEFQAARANGFASLAKTGVFDPAYGCPGDSPGPTCLPFFNYIYGGAIGNSTINNLIYQGQIGSLIELYHANTYDSSVYYGPPGTPPGPGNLVNWFSNPYIMGADLLKNTSFSSYNAGIVEVRRRFSKGLYFQANYTFSKVMTDYDALNSNGQETFLPYQDNARPFLEKHRAGFDITHAFKANFTYELPIGKGHRLFGNPGRALGLLVNGWQTGNIFTWQTGAPFSILSGYATFNRGSRSTINTAVATLTHQQISGDLGTFVQNNGVVYGINPKLISPDGTGAPSSPQLGGCTPAVAGGFCNPQPGEVGTLQQDAFNGPSYFDWDMSAAKDFNLTERFKLTFRTEAFNLLNHPVFFLGDQNINSTTFGQSSSTISIPRVLQMSLRLKF